MSDTAKLLSTNAEVISDKEMRRTTRLHHKMKPHKRDARY